MSNLCENNFLEKFADRFGNMDSEQGPGKQNKRLRTMDL